MSEVLTAAENPARPRPASRQRLRGVLLRICPQGYGFIHTLHGGDYYVNVAQIEDRADWVENTEVSFYPGSAKPGKAPAAYRVRAVPKSRGQGSELKANS